MSRRAGGRRALSARSRVALSLNTRQSCVRSQQKRSGRVVKIKRLAPFSEGRCGLRSFGGELFGLKSSQRSSGECRFTQVGVSVNSPVDDFQAVSVCAHSISGASNRMHAKITSDMEARTPSAAPTRWAAPKANASSIANHLPIGSANGWMASVSQAPGLVLTAPNALARPIAMEVRTAAAQRERRRSRR